MLVYKIFSVFRAVFLPDFHLGKKVFRVLVLGGIQSSETISENLYPITFHAVEFRPQTVWVFLFLREIMTSS